MEINKLVRPNIKLLHPYQSARDEFDGADKKYVFLDANENPNQNGVNRYPDPQQGALKEKLALLKGVATDHIFLGNGSDEALDVLMRTFCEPGRDNIITLPPTYGMYGALAAINNIEVREVILLEDLQPDVSGILAAADRHSKIIFLCSPNNPTGNSFEARHIEAILQGFKGLVVIDEAYIDFSRDTSWIANLQQYENLVIVQTFSKAYGLAGIRIGALYAGSGIVSYLNKVKPPYNINRLSQKKLFSRLLQNDILRRDVTEIISERQKLVEKLKAIKFITMIYPSDANFILVQVDDAQRRYSELLGKGIVVRNRSNQQRCGNCLRITVGSPDENKILLKTLKSM